MKLKNLIRIILFPVLALTLLMGSCKPDNSHSSSQKNNTGPASTWYYGCEKRVFMYGWYFKGRDLNLPTIGICVGWHYIDGYCDRDKVFTEAGELLVCDESIEGQLVKTR